MAEHVEQRRFWRVPFRSAALLTDAAGSVHKGRLQDISLKGALLEMDADWQGRLGDGFRFRLELAPDVAICMQATTVHVEGHRVGLRCDEIDLDSITALRRLVSLNSGDQQLLGRELRELIGG